MVRTMNRIPLRRLARSEPPQVRVQYCMPSTLTNTKSSLGKTASRKKIKVDDEDEAVLKIENDDEAEDFEI